MRRLLFASFLLSAAPVMAQTQGAPADDVHSEASEIIVTAPYARERIDALSSVSVLDADALARQLAPSIGDTLARQPGVSASSFAPGASRPILRGFQGDRVRVLTDGIGAIDASNTSADHAVTIDPITAERIEVVRGPASLLYGSSAIGGAVNVIDRRIPRRVPEHVHADLIAGFGSAASERSLGGGIDAPLASGLVAHIDGSWRKTDDLRIGGYLLSPGARAEARIGAARGNAEAAELLDKRGRLPNSATETTTVAGGLAWIGSTANLGVSLARFDTRYGVPERPDLAPPVAGAPAHAHEDVSIDMGQTRLDIRGEAELGGFFERVKLRAGGADYKHTEFEGADPGTVFRNKGREARLEFVQANRGGWRGAVGLQGYTRKLEAIGDEAFLPPNRTGQFGVFTLQEFDLGRVNLEASARYEATEVKASSLRLKRSFDALSGALGASYAPADDWRLGVNLSRTVRAPSAEELFSDGPHAATQSYEIGDPDFAAEKAWGLEGFIRTDSAGFNLSAAIYANWFSDYIYETATGAVKDDLPVFQFRQADATYVGFELEASAPIATVGGWTLVADGVADATRATVKSVGPAPRIPPLRLLGGLEAQGEQLTARVEVERVTAQSRRAAFETRTAAYTMVNASLSWTPFAEARDVTLLLATNNLFDVDARRHASFLKDYAPLAGRDVRLTLRASF
jgi:iron complex outermembrane receptor protein